jgi:valyl-tRNA synthetase
MTKARFSVSERRQPAQRVLAHALDVLLKLLHPMMPFLTEEVWHLLGLVAPERGLPHSTKALECVCVARWPWEKGLTLWHESTIESQFADFQAVLGAIREIRQTHNIPQREEIYFSVLCNQETADLLRIMQPYFTQMGHATAVWGADAIRPDLTPRILAGHNGQIELYVDVSRFIDVAAERKRLEKQRDELTKFAKSISGKLSNKSFVDKAPAEVVEQQRAKLAEVEGQLSSVAAALQKLSEK